MRELINFDFLAANYIMESHFITDLGAIDKSRIYYLASQVYHDKIEDWLIANRRQYPQNLVWHLLHSEPDLSASLIVHAITGIPSWAFINCNTFDAQIGKCYYVRLHDANHTLVIIPGRESHQVIQSLLPNRRLFSTLMKFTTIAQLADQLGYPCFSHTIRRCTMSNTIQQFSCSETQLDAISQMMADYE